MKTRDKTMLVQAFIRGQSVKDLAIFFACADLTVQDILRDAITGLSDLNAAYGLELRKMRAAQPEPETVETL